MSINLAKGQKVDLTKNNPNLKKIKVCLGWDTNKYTGGDFDLDASVFLLNNTSKAQSEKDFVFYNNLRHDSGAVIHSGDNRTGLGEGDDEMITVEFTKIPLYVDKISFVVTIFDADKRRQNFGMVSNSFARVVDADTNTEILRYSLGEDFSVETAIVACEVYKYGNEWKFNAVGSGYQGGLAALVKSFGLNYT